jgi:hypothetical protein
MAVFAVLTLRVLPASWRATQTAWRTFSARAQLLNQEQTNLRQAAVLEDSGATIRARVIGLAPKLLSAVREAEAQADLSTRLQHLAASNHVRLERVTPVADSTRVGRLRPVRLSVSFVGDTRGTLRLLGALAGGPVVLTTSDLRITATNPTAPGTVAEELRTEIAVRGWYAAKDSDR